MGVHVGYEANDLSLKHSSPVYGVSVFFIYYTVKLNLSSVVLHVILLKETICFQPMLLNANPLTSLTPVPKS